MRPISIQPKWKRTTDLVQYTIGWRSIIIELCQKLLQLSQWSVLAMAWSSWLLGDGIWLIGLNPLQLLEVLGH